MFVVVVTHSANVQAHTSETWVDAAGDVEEADGMARRLATQAPTTTTKAPTRMPKLGTKASYMLGIAACSCMAITAATCCFLGYKRQVARYKEEAENTLEFTDEDGDIVKYEYDLSERRLYQSVNGERFIGPNVDRSTNGMLTKLSWTQRSGTGGVVKDQKNLEVVLPTWGTEKLWHLAEKSVGLQHNIPAPTGFVSSQSSSQGATTPAWQDSTSGNEVTPLKIGGAQHTGHTAHDDICGV